MVRGQAGRRGEQKGDERRKGMSDSCAARGVWGIQLAQDKGQKQSGVTRVKENKNLETEAEE